MASKDSTSRRKAKDLSSKKMIGSSPANAVQSNQINHPSSRPKSNSLNGSPMNDGDSPMDDGSPVDDGSPMNDGGSPMKISKFPPHQDFHSTSTQRSICDGCKEITDFTLNKCRTCSSKICRECMYRINEDGTIGDGIHSAREGDVLEWGSTPWLTQPSASERWKLVTAAANDSGKGTEEVNVTAKFKQGENGGMTRKRIITSTSSSDIQAAKRAVARKKDDGLIYLPWNGAWAVEANLSKKSNERLNLLREQRGSSLAAGQQTTQRRTRQMEQVGVTPLRRSRRGIVQAAKNDDE